MINIFILLKMLYYLASVEAQEANAQVGNGHSDIVCQNLFSVENLSNNLTTREITLNRITSGTHKIRVLFAQKNSTAGVSTGSENSRPKLILLSLDNEVLCSNSKTVPASSDIIELEETVKFLNKNVSNEEKQEFKKNAKKVANLAEPPKQTSSSNKMEQFEESHGKPNTSDVLNPKCGREGTRKWLDSEAQPRIFGGTDVYSGQFPWLAAIRHQSTLGNWEFKCGGNLISARLVLTAAHCLVDVYNKLVTVRVDLGRHNIKAAHEANEVHIPTEMSILHPDFMKHSFADADMGLVLLKDTVTLPTHITPICLWTGPNDLKSIVGSMGFVVGWGIDESCIGSSMPKMVSVPVASELDCRKNHPIFFNLLTERTLCAGRLDGSGPLQGDSGGALIIQNGDRWMLRAVVSLGIKRSGNDKHAYVIYCDLAKFTTWIQEEIQKWS